MPVQPLNYTTEKRTLPEGAKEFSLYHDEVQMIFNPNSPRYRYTVTDAMLGVKDFSVRGVTTVIGDIIDKPELRTWPMNMSNSVLFGTHFDEKLLEYVHKWEKALIKPEEAYSADRLHEIMLEGSREWTKRSDKGKDVGTLAHNAIEAYLKGENPQETFPEPKDDKELEFNIRMAHNALDAFVKWWTSLPDKDVIFIEKPIYSRNLKYAGTFDLYVRIGNKNYILDIKTTNVSKKAPMGIYSEMFLQLGGYAYAFNEETGNIVDDVGIIRVGKDGRLFIATAGDLRKSVDECMRAFAFAVRLHDWLENVKPFVADAKFISHLSPSQQVDTENAIN